MTPSPSRVLALDAGRSGCRAAWFGAQGRGPTGHGPPLPAATGPGVVERIVRVLGETASAVAAPGPADVLSAGVAGLLGSPGPGRAVTEGLGAILGVGRVLVTGDVVTAYCGALGLRPGVVVVAGTGAVALAVGPEGATARAGGAGPLLGDPGSGLWIGRRGLGLALRAHDGRGGSALLQELAERDLGPLDDLPARLHAAAGPTAMVAAFARRVAEAAHHGDPGALAIRYEAVRELAAAAGAAARRALPGTGPVPLSWAGGLLTADGALRDAFLDHLAAVLPAARPVAPAGDSLDGAALLALAPGATVMDRLVHDSARPHPGPAAVAATAGRPRVPVTRPR